VSDAAVSIASAMWRPPLDDPPDLEAVFSRFVDPVYRFLYSHVGNREDAEDLTSQVFEKGIRYLDPDAAPQEAAAYLYRVARATIADYWRRYTALRVVPIDETPGVLEREEAPVDNGTTVVETLATDLERILALLPPTQRRVLELRFIHQCSIKETARLMGISVANAKILQYRAIQRATSYARGEGVAT
jgi:RNA polymerase sigma-70 factor (ECF subfamily)